MKPTVQKPLLTGATLLEDLLPFVYAVQRGLLGEHSFILDRTALALLLAASDSRRFELLSARCPAFVCLQNVAGFERLPEERLEYHLKDIRTLAERAGLSLQEGIGDVSAAKLLATAEQTCGPIDWRDRHQGDSISIFFITTLDRAPAFRERFRLVAQEFGIAEVAFGTYIQPIVQNHACHVEFIVPFDPASEAERQRMKRLERQAVIGLMDDGAFFSRPYGSAAELVWQQNPANYQLLQTVKGIFDPNRVLQRGKWGL